MKTIVLAIAMLTIATEAMPQGTQQAGVFLSGPSEVFEGSGGGITTVPVTVKRVGATDREELFWFRVVDIDPSDLQDDIPQAGGVTLFPGENSKVIHVWIKADNTREPDELLKVEAFNQFTRNAIFIKVRNDD